MYSVFKYINAIQDVLKVYYAEGRFWNENVFDVVFFVVFYKGVKKRLVRW